LNLSHKQAIFLARNAWQTSRRQLAKTKVEIAKLAKAQKVDPADLAEVNSQIDALSQQIAATSQDLAEAPRTQEGFKAVVETAGGLIEQFTSFTSQGGDVPPSFREAQKTFVEGLARILPLSGTKAEAIDMVRTSLTDLANRLAPLAGEEAEEAKEEKDDAKKGPDPDEPDPHAAQPIAPPGPSPLPPPPLPPGKKPVPAGT
jgi:septal ring factor EnvC (AmiA/AmiB activator)